MRIGLVARADCTGLAVQTYEFWRHMQPSKTLVITINGTSPPPHDMYPGAVAYQSPYPDLNPHPDGVIESFLDDLDLVFTCETPYNYWLYQRARERGVKTVQQFNFEYLDHVANPHIHKPDLFAAPSMWRWADVPFPNKVYLPVPVARDRLPFRHRTELRTLLHVGGVPVTHDRNGTQRVIEAMRLLPDDVPVKLRLRTQSDVFVKERYRDRIEVVHEIVPDYWSLYGDEDAMILPRKFGGLCLPFNEASSCGMPVLTTAVDPQVRFFPPPALVPARRVGEFHVRNRINLYDAEPQELADRITYLHRNPHVMAALSLAADRYADSISWERLKPVYEKTFERLCNGERLGVAA